MCQSAIKLITSQLHTVNNDDLLLKIKGRIALFMLTMEVGNSIDHHVQIANDRSRNGATLSL